MTDDPRPNPEGAGYQGQVSTENEIARVEPAEALQPMEWEPTQPVTFINWKLFLEEQAMAGIYTHADPGITLTITMTPGPSAGT